ncbi:MAG TPA: hypothetical protein GX008_07185 [Firmicutes bacterium]|jgi:hypothetical protein|nr:MAG: hypothetical protein AA931_00815 [Peptococcaceae bacterium 1109]HHT73480.1 hypothetical protein [Bacillota bacterium]
MAWRFIRNALFALIIFLVIGLISRIDLPVTQPVEEYLAFVISTDLSLDPVAEQLGKVGKLVSEWDLSALVQGLPRIEIRR